MHVILGANGVIGREISRTLAARGHSLRQVARHPNPETTADQCVAADLLDGEAVAAALVGAKVAYLVAGLRYDASVWADQWPRVMDNAIEASIRAGCRLVFFDNVYAYGRVDGPMTEETPFNPCSRKGEVRARIATTLLGAIARQELSAMIVRAADFYGPGASNSFPESTVFSRLAAGKVPQWIGDPEAIHSFTYTPDAGQATALLGIDPSRFGRTWHLPTSGEALTGRNFVRTAAAAANRPDQLQRAPRWLLRAMGWFVPVLRENDEMMYQFEHDYRFDSSRIAHELDLRATPYAEGIAACLSGRARGA